MKIYVIHPADKDLNFLKSAIEYLKEKYKGNLEYLRLEPTHRSHEYCLKKLKENPNSTILLFCHALEKSIRGCKIESPASGITHRNFNYGSFISPSNNIEVFSKNKVFALACFSKDLGPSAIKSGAKVYLGFGDIDFFVTENFKEQIVINIVKENLRKIICNTLCNAIDNDLTFNDLSRNICLSIDITRNNLQKNKEPGRQARIEASKAFSKIKNGMTMFGDGNLLVI